jgi:hypothetical protein
MADFGELCPLFNSGVFNTITFPDVALSTVSIGANLLAGTNEALTYSGNFTFGRTVVVTEAWVKRSTVGSIFFGIDIVHRATAMAAGTVFGSVTLSISLTAWEIGYTWQPFPVIAEKTFTSDEVLSFQTNVRVSSCNVAFMVKYKEK